MGSSKSKISFIGSADLILMSSLLSLALLEDRLRVVHAKKDASFQARAMLQDPRYGWDSIPEITVLHEDPTIKEAIYFAGDSFTQNTEWPSAAVEGLAKKGMRVNAFNLGVSGYGTVQEFLKIKNTFEFHHPKVVVLLFFAWNDPRDNFDNPAIYYNLETRHRAYLWDDGNAIAIVPAAGSRWFEELELYKMIFPKLEYRLARAIIAFSGLDTLTRHHIPLELDYSLKDSWLPFYEPSLPSKYREEAWIATERAFLALKTFLNDHHSRLIVIGIDNAFTVDQDVYDSYLRPLQNKIDVHDPLRRTKAICEQHQIVYIDGLPILQALSLRLKQKIYLGPPGNLSGHLTPEGYKAIGEATAAMVSAQWLH
jgi:hypothetical protein